MNKNLEAPCKSCTLRYLCCHDSCDKYKQFKSNLQEVQVERIKFLDKTVYAIESTKRSNKYKCHWKGNNIKAKY